MHQKQVISWCELMTIYLETHFMINDIDHEWICKVASSCCLLTQLKGYHLLYSCDLWHLMLKSVDVLKVTLSANWGQNLVMQFAEQGHFEKRWRCRQMQWSLTQLTSTWYRMSSSGGYLKIILSFLLRYFMNLENWLLFPNSLSF